MNGRYDAVNYSRTKSAYPEFDDNTEHAAEKRFTNMIELNELRKGDKGAQVKSLQILLIGSGYSCGGTGADGSFGANTEAAVRKYQKAKGLSVDGIAGKNTFTKLLKG